MCSINAEAEKGWKSLLKNDLSIVLDKLRRVIFVWETIDSPMRCPDILGPSIISILILLFKNFKSNGVNFNFSILLYPWIVVLGVIFNMLVITFKMINISIYQIADMFIYSRIWWILAFFINLFLSDNLKYICALVIPLNMFSFKRLGYLVIPEDVSLSLTLLNIIPEIIIFCWAVLT